MMYFFHVHSVDGVIEEDTIGAPFDTDAQAIQEARDFTHEMMRETAEHDGTVEHSLEVTDEHGRSVIRLAYRATLDDSLKGRVQ